ncbi:MAG: hypothetical protein JW703_05600 [Candidatus Diapherotrites archaeon]|nr:hypothetical protein [Candidatus Diapherotrites archaeon]
MESSNKVAVDTNMLLAITQFNVPITTLIKEKLGNTEFFFPTQVKKELNGLKKELRKEVSIAEKIMEQEKFTEKKVDAKNADDALLELSKKGFIIATNDKELKKRIQETKGKILFLRQKKLIEIL